VIYLKAKQKFRLSRLGSALAGLYALLFVGLCLYISNFPPSGLGYEFLPIMWLAFPWGFIEYVGPWAGFILNAIILYFLGALFGRIWRQNSEE
jgi:hypothetical protein